MREGAAEQFWEALAVAEQRVLMLDYDGTLAPFVVNRDEAVPYPGVREALAELLAAGHTRVVIISGRAVADVARLVGVVEGGVGAGPVLARLPVGRTPSSDISPPWNRGRGMAASLRRAGQALPLPEIWGSHGLERCTADGCYSVRELPAGVQAALEAGAELACHHVDALRVELKPGCVALHVRGLTPDAASALLATVEAGWRELVGSAGMTGTETCPTGMTDAGVRPTGDGMTGTETCSTLLLRPFDGGLELRVGGVDKGAAVNEVLADAGSNTVAAYLGDDLTDEDAFRALTGRGLGILVRSEPRESLAEAWIRPPDGLLEFLRRWHVIASGQQQK